MADARRDHDRDVTFQVPQVHRVRFTEHVLERETHILLDLLESSGGGPPRVQFWLDSNVARAAPWVELRIEAHCRRHRDRMEWVEPIEHVPGGEAIKNDVHVLERMLKVMHAAELDRRSYVVVIGGGAVLDAVGFAAAIAHRGIRLVRLPTTTLAQADSGIGVKNGVNLFHQKNWLGTYTVPWGVVNDVALLESLSDRDYRCGFSEAVKVALLKCPAMFEQLEQTADRIRLRDAAACGPIIRRSAQLHLDHITQGGDPFETREARPLDFGHWLAHRLEVMTDFQLRHGEAVAIGVALDTVYSSLAHGLAPRDADRVLVCLGRLGFPLYHPALHHPEELFSGLEEFRRHLGGRLTLTMISPIGRSFEVHDVDHARMRAALERVIAFGQSVSAGSRQA